MNKEEFLEGINQKYFDGQLSKAQISHLSNLDINNVEAVEFARGVLQRMKRIGISAKDTAELVFWEIASILPKILPGAWGGIVPPITFPNRHVLVEEYMRVNHWNPLKPGNAVLDMGCGFPPLTAVDMAKRFPDVKVIGADPSFGKYTVSDIEGNYACILEDGSLKYMQPANISTSQWNDVFDDINASKKWFMDMFHELEKQLPEEESENSYEEYSSDGHTIVRNPLRKYASANLSFVQQGIGSEGFPKNLDMIRCMNVLLYFDPAFRADALKWAARFLREGGLFICGLNYAQSINCRISVYQKQEGVMKFREFAFSPDNIRPMEVVSYFSFREDDFEQDQLLKYVAMIRSNPAFMKEFNDEFDQLLQKHNICSRGTDGYLGFIDTEMPPGQLQLNMHQLGRWLSKAYANGAAKVLQSLGVDAEVNEIGFISIRKLD
jgi:SAM-dependent methyltransferase